MAGKTPYKPDWKQKFVAELSRDKKKTCILAVLLLLGVVMGMRVVFKTHPAKAQAKAALAPAEAPKAFPARTAPAPAADGDARIEERIRMNDRRIDRDLFVPDVQAFPLAPVKSKKPAPTGTARTNQKSTEEIVQELARELTLQSTIISAQPTAIINGELLNVKGTINGFVLKKITSGACEISKDGVTVRLVMERDPDERKKK